MNSTDITNIADQYKIKSVKVKIHANTFTVGWAGNGSIGQPWIEYIQDYDDAQPPPLSLMREKMGVRTKFFSANRPTITMGVRPRVADVVYNNGVTTGYAVNGRNQFLDTQYPGIEHYGIKGVLHNVQLNGSTPFAFDWDVTEYITASRLQ